MRLLKSKDHQHDHFSYKMSLSRGFSGSGDGAVVNDQLTSLTFQFSADERARIEAIIEKAFTRSLGDLVTSAASQQ
jgi:hypothetical protein